MSDNYFEERAENLTKDELQGWTALTQRDRNLINKLKGPGAKLLTGPRGSGKSTLIRYAYYELLEEQSSFPVYVNYSHSLRLEPYFHTQANAAVIFRQWVLAQILKGANEASQRLRAKLPTSLAALAVNSEKLIQSLEKGEAPSDEALTITVAQLVSGLESICHSAGFKRVVLLLDDAAHAFSEEQQSEFFELFRQLRTRYISPKAAVYPGITAYSPNFHVGHEAEQLNAWYDAGSEHYIASMIGMLGRRLPAEKRALLDGREEIVELLAHCAFGIPRGFLTMLSALIDRIEEGGLKGGWTDARPIIEGHAQSVRKVFASLEARLPKFKNFVELGFDLEKSMLENLRKRNSLKEDPSEKTTQIGIEEPVAHGLDRVLHMLEYAGVVRDVGSSQSRGTKGSYKRYFIHHALVASDNALSLGRSFSLRSVSEALAARDSHNLVRIKATTLLGSDYESRCTLNLSPCTRCGAERMFAEQKYCMRCGNELRDRSIYHDLLNTSIARLPLPDKKIEGILQHTTLRTVNDILSDEQNQVRNVPYVGSTWAQRIRLVAEEFVSV